MPKASSTAAYSCDIVSEYNTADNEEVEQEIDIMVNTFEGVKVSGRSKSRKKLTIPIASDKNPLRRLQLVITTVQGYPHLPPHVQLVFPAGIRPGDPNALSENEIAQIRKDVEDNIKPCLSFGMPCLMQIASTVAEIVANGCPEPVSPPAHGGSRSGVSAKANSPGASPIPGQSPALTPVPLKAKDAMKLSLLTLHLLRKCCHMRHPESKEEANSSFEWLAKYLVGTVNVFPPAASMALPWRGDAFARAFPAELDQAAHRALQHVHPAADVERTDLTKWLWESEELPVKLQQGTEGRYVNEFIEQRILGAGGFAPVYVCRKKIDGRLYAIKKVVMTEGQSEKIIREVQTLAALNHKNIVRYYDAWVEDGCEEDLKRFLGDDDDEEDEDEEEDDEAEQSDDASTSRVEAQVKRATLPLPPTLAATAMAPAEEAGKDPRQVYGMLYPSSSSSSSSPATSSSAEEGSYSDSDSSENDSEGTTDAEDAERGASDCKPVWSGQGSTKCPDSKKKGRTARAYQTLYIQMELCSTRSLRHLIEESDSEANRSIFGSQSGEKVAAAILRQLLSVTAHTHRENIVHRDLKPDNVLFEMDNDYADGDFGTIRVADFGLARVMNDVKRNTSHAELTDAQWAQTAVAGLPTGNLGTVLYCAPEQEKGSDYGFKVDEFSIGMIALEMWLAIAGKGFRDRFIIMNEVWRSGKLPEWFVVWKPSMAEVIGSLLEIDQQKRRSCEEVLSTADLPGDPADLIDALGTIDRYGERIVPRVMQRIQKLSSQYRKPPPTMREAAQLLASLPITDFSQAVSLVGLLHGSAAVSFYEPVILMNPSLGDLGLESLMDSSGRNYCYSVWPQFGVASFLGMQESQSIGPFLTFHHKTRSFATFTSPTKRSDEFSEALLEPLLSFLHLLLFVDVTSRVEIIISHADWLNMVFPREVGDRSSPKGLLQHRTLMDTPERVSLAVSQIGDAMANEGLAASDERDNLIRRYATAVLEVIQYYGRGIASHVAVVLDPALEPSESLVNRACLTKGLFFECRVEAAHSPVPMAFGCEMGNFVPHCTVSCPEAGGFSVSIDAGEFVSCWRHLRVTAKEGLLLDGVAVRRQDQYSLSQLPSVLEAAIVLWKGGIRAVLRTESDIHALSRSLKAKHIRHILVDGKRIVPCTSAQQNKVVSKQPDVAPDQLRQAIRALALEERANHYQANQTDTEVLFLSGREDKRVAEEAREVFDSMTGQVKGPIVIMQADAVDVERALRDFAENAEPQSSCAPLVQWLKMNTGSLGITPVFAAKDSKMLLFVNQKKFRPQRRKDGNNGAKKKK